MFISELHSLWPLKRSCKIPALLLFEMLFSRLLFPVCQRAGACRSSEQNWVFFFTWALLFEGGLSGQISITSVVMELRLFWKASLSPHFQPRVLGWCQGWDVSSRMCLFWSVDLWRDVLFYTVRNIRGKMAFTATLFINWDYTMFEKLLHFAFGTFQDN